MSDLWKRLLISLAPVGAATAMFCVALSIVIAQEAGVSPEQQMKKVIDTAAGPIHSVLVAHRGELVFELYRSGVDQPWGKPKGDYVYDAGALHDMRSISKSIVSLLVGIAVDRGEIDIDKSVFAYLPEYQDFATPEKQKITIRNLLAMDSGLVANEMVLYDDPNNTERLMSIADDPVRYSLGRNLIYPPGRNWAYDGGSTMVLAKVLKNVRGRDLLPLAERDLFEPLGIRKSEWIRLRKSGEYAAHGGLRLLPWDLLKFGELLLADGRWNGRLIVSPAWLLLSTATLNDAWYTDHYGLHWWSGTTVLEDGRLRASMIKNLL